MSVAGTVQLVLAVMSVIIIPLVALMIRLIIRWSKMESALSSLTKDVSDLVRNKEATHTAMLDTMREDRKATDRRLRWLEENVWNNQGRRAA